jgi:hypothetical protein
MTEEQAKAHIPLYVVVQAALAVAVLLWRVLGVDGARLPADWPFVLSLYALASVFVSNERAATGLALAAGGWLAAIHLSGQVPLVLAALRQGPP